MTALQSAPTVSPVPLLDAVLWVLAVGFYGVGDYLTTVAATTRSGARETNPFVRGLFERVPVRPAVSFAVAKLLAFGCFTAGYLSVAQSPFRTLIPGSVAVIGVLVTVQNVRVLGVGGFARRGPY
ncbi:hypothetical protein [Halogeometricum limi]|uniref:DUF5658 domain-containing protein n=1 Tax=Halogeometricum limi TaxID=555875 RepID=A0A1I6FTP4_9EURY|nr:hypothetical protein [Halogeometricum limi]SFR33322.1 hypothetical protein SAMN04488124_0281 [Halogeometricum limi]